MTNINSGQLAFLPSGLTLIQFSPKESADTPTKWMKISKPAHVLVVGEQDDTPYCLVLYNGEKWSVPKNKVYPFQEAP